MTDWTVDELEAAISKLEDEIAEKEDAAETLRRKLWKIKPNSAFRSLRPRVEFSSRQDEDIYSFEHAKIGMGPRIRSSGGHSEQ